MLRDPGDDLSMSRANGRSSMRAALEPNNTADEPLAAPVSRRRVLHRSLLGTLAVGLAGILAACGDDEEEPAPSGSGAEDPGEEPGAGEETGIGDDEAGGTEESEEELSTEEGLGDEEDGD
jgi:hypothetical protein